jgi:hypothetical protein
MRYQAALRPDCGTNTLDINNFKGLITSNDEHIFKESAIQVK